MSLCRSLNVNILMNTCKIWPRFDKGDSMDDKTKLNEKQRVFKIAFELTTSADIRLFFDSLRCSLVVFGFRSWVRACSTEAAW